MRPGPSPKGLLMKRKVLSASAKMFLEKGYAGTSSKQVAELLEVSNGSPFFQYGNKEGVLLELVKRMSKGQFKTAADILGADSDPLLLCSVETALQMRISELSEPLRELYVTAYSLPTTSLYIYRVMSERLYKIFGSFQPQAKARDFYEMEIASASMIRGYMAIPCDVYFTIEDKLTRFLDCALKLYNVEPQERERIIAATCAIDLRETAKRVVRSTVQKVEDGVSITGQLVL